MTAAEQAVLEAASRSGLLPARQPVLVLLSGGRDSMCLLDVARRVAGEGAVTALHLNYRLRPAADEDEQHCRQLCAQLGIALSVEHPQTAPAGNVQAWARELRYRLAEREAAARDASVAVGHTASDQAETVLYRLAASPGRRALLGMRPRVGRVVRPLLEVGRDQTAAYCQARGLAWREDESNLDGRYARARVRSQLMPVLRTLHPAAEANIVRTAQLLREEGELLDAIVDSELGERTSLPATRLAAMPAALARLVVLRLAEEAAGRPAPDAARRTDEIISLGERRRRGSLDLGGGLRAVIEAGELSFEAGPARPGWASWRAGRTPLGRPRRGAQERRPS